MPIRPTAARLGSVVSGLGVLAVHDHEELHRPGDFDDRPIRPPTIVYRYRVDEPLGLGWAAIARADTGFDPLQGTLSNGCVPSFRTLASPITSKTRTRTAAAAARLSTAGSGADQQQAVRQADDRSSELVRARQHRQVRSDGALLRVLAARLFRYGRWYGQHASSALGQLGQVCL